MTGGHFLEGRALLTAPVGGVGAAAGKAAAGAQVHGAGDAAVEHDALAAGLQLGVGQRDGREHGLGIGVEGMPKISSLVVSSTMLPRYMTPMRSEMCLTMDRSWAMKR